MERLKSPYLDSQMARYYAAASAPNQFDQPARDLVDRLQISQGQKVLDIGSGSGLIAAAVAAKGGSAGVTFALDSSIEMIRQQRENRVIRVVAHAQDLPFGDGVFDRIAAGFVITHLPDSAKALLEWRRVLRPGGILTASAWETGASKVSEVWKQTVQKYINPAMVEKEFARVIPSDEFFSVRDNLIEAFKNSGLIDAKAETRNYLITMSVRQYVDTKIGSVEGTIIRKHLGKIRWDQLLQDLANNLQEAFPLRVEYSRNVHFVSAQKPIQ